MGRRLCTANTRDFLLGLRQRGLHRSEFVVSDDHAGLKQAIREVLPERVAALLRALPAQHAGPPAAAGERRLPAELRWIYDRRELAEVRRDLAAWLAKWSGKYARLCAWVEENIEETLTYCGLPLTHHKHMKSTSMLKRLNQEIKRRTHVVRISRPRRVACGWCVRWRSRRTRSGWRAHGT